MEKLNDYVVTLCRVNSTDVMAVRVQARNKTDIYKMMDQEYPDWKMKNVLRLYSEDFQE